MSKSRKNFLEQNTQKKMRKKKQFRKKKKKGKTEKSNWGMLRKRSRKNSDQKNIYILHAQGRKSIFISQSLSLAAGQSCEGSMTVFFWLSWWKSWHNILLLLSVKNSSQKFLWTMKIHGHRDDHKNRQDRGLWLIKILFCLDGIFI